MPESASQMLAGLTFPVSAILILLSISNVVEFNKKYKQTLKLALAFCVSILMILVIGDKYFWIPSIFFCYFILSRDKHTKVADEH